MNAEVKQRWIEALRSGKYKQGKYYLNANNNYCCLGVLCDISGQGIWISKKSGISIVENYVCSNSENYKFLPSEIRDWSGVNSEQENRLSIMNDRGASFEEIATFIEENL